MHSTLGYLSPMAFEKKVPRQPARDGSIMFVLREAFYEGKVSAI